MTYNMDIEQIKLLLSRFYEGQTTPDEERQLAAYFRCEDIPEELQEDKQLLLMLANISDQEIPADIAEDITAFVNNLGQTEKEPALSETKQHKGIIYRLKTPPKMLYRAAATVAVILALGGGIGWYKNINDPYRDTCATAEDAAMQIQRASNMITRASEQCLAPTNKALQQVDATTKIINQYINF